MKCYLCNGIEFKVRADKVRDNENISVIECVKCSLVTLSDINHIDDSHYKKGNMHNVGYSKEQWIDETKNDDLRRLNFLKDKIINKKILDFGCGNAGFLLNSEKFTQINHGIELEESMFPYFKSKGLKVWKSLDDAIIKSELKYDVITSFHVFEHLSDPVNVLSQLSGLLSEEGEIIIEVPNSNDALLTFYKNSDFSDFTYWSQHLFLYNEINICELVKKSGLKVNWVKQIQRYKLSNHLYWLSNGKPGGHNIWKNFNDKNLDEIYSKKLASLGICDTIMVSCKI